ncbi:hypothetical protein H9Q70_011064 [Fusarium xylarioides]|nr:hypothetical protein H9Q70_011064 [Fusarium xylarioides]KAG5780704.1 hypothetical protein H9Q73_005646 [Fusarium xylarioides]
MSRRLISLLLSGLITQAGAQYVVEEPDTVCVTYLSTYIVPVTSNATGSVPTDGANSTSQTFDAASTALTTFESGINPSLDLTETLQFFQSLSDSTNQFIAGSVTTDTNTADSDPTTAPVPGDQLVVFRIVPDTDNSKRRRLKRALGGFVGSTSEICQDASAFSLSDGRLLDGGRPIYYNGEDFKELRGQQESLPRGAIATTFAGDGGFLRFRSPDLPNGEASFCQSPGTGQVYITFTSLPPGCVSVKLSVVGVNECEDGQTSASAGPTSTDLQTMKSTVDSLATSLPFSTVISVVSTDPSDDTTLVDFTTLALPSLEPTQTRPVQTSSFRFSNTSTVAFPTVPIETSEDFSFTNIPGVTFTPSDEATTADALPTDVLSSESQLNTEDATSSLPEVTTSTVPEIDTPTSESSISTSGTGTTVDIETTIDMETTINTETTISMETTSTTATLESASTSDITTEVSTTTSEAETTTTTSPPSRACESYLINPTVLFSGDQDNEDGVEELTLPFPVGLYTESSETIYVGVNGLISLFDNSIAQSSNNPFPDNGLPSVAIAAYWDNLRIKGNAGYEITYRVYDDADYRAVNIDWCVVDADDVVTHFMVVLRAYDLSNPESVFIRYFQSNRGKSATIAVQNLADAKSQQFSYNMENAVPDGCTVLFFTIGGDERVVYVPP